MKCHWHVIYGVMIVLFIACAIAIPNQFLPWLSTAIMTATAMLWHRERDIERETVKGMKKIVEFWRTEARKAQHELDVLSERTRDEETDRERSTVNIHTQYHEKFGEVLAEIIRRAAPEIPESETRE
ncbi:hypothetical protein HMPREF1484_00229 [Dermabacter sp. HFH0086]|uniref:hypothetical protein n=1 Tax=Dermabacter TaxID=36739 RepID=UPI000353C240|nr:MULTISPECIES: hypothetical protein [Dermabacter]EPH17544.1 hypothetical protein HMPREF1484_00229 [Dermabacter sp. HFH0086]